MDARTIPRFSASLPLARPLFDAKIGLKVHHSVERFLGAFNLTVNGKRGIWTGYSIVHSSKRYFSSMIVKMCSNIFPL